MTKWIYALLFLFISASMTAESQVTWYTEFDEALAVAQAEKKNVFVLITAPSWCIWCTRLEENVLSKDHFQDYQSENYISLKLLDKIGGVRNPELEHFDFSGYPSVFLYDYEGRFIQNIYTQDPEVMLASMSKYREAEGKFRPLLKDLLLPEKFTFTDKGGGEYINEGNKTWTLKSGGEDILYKQTRYDFDYIYLELISMDPDSIHVIALPMKGSDSHIAHLVDEKWKWSDLGNVRRVGGDPYFE